MNNKTYMKLAAAAFLGSALTTFAWADITNTAMANFSDVVGNLYTIPSNTVVIVVSTTEVLPSTPTLSLPRELPLTATITAGYNDPEDPAAAFNWTFTPQSQSSLGTSASAAFSSGAPSLTMQTFSPEASLSAVPSLVPGRYLITVSVVDGNNHVSPTAQATVTLLTADLTNVRLYPNPWKANKHEGLPVKFDNLTANSTVKIFSLSGREVRALPKSSGTVTWDLMNESGDKVASGIYIYLIKTDDGQKKTGKLAIIK